MQVLILNGVNLDVLGRRDPSVYGGISLNELETRIYEWAHELGVSVRCRQSNSEGEFIGWIHDAYDDADALVVNPGAWTHYSYAIHDALEPFAGPVVEVHLSNIEGREDWRRHSVIADVVSHRVLGKGPEGYRDALVHLQGGAS
ncbi:MAG: 3-dehydroquinate dehydratase [Actinobacteria bacterium]|nr:3-dehydroquinate dehydratase [Actinomycetota bacterium]MBV8395348.1 3-dehydroquinate dehydratase [Actinomycetota bacterium]